MDRVVIGYVAGLIDGEGCIRIAWQGRGRGYGLRVQVAMVTEAPLRRLRALYGGSIYRGHVRSGRVYYQWVASAGAARALLAEICPYLLVKQEQAKLGLEFQALIGTGLPRYHPSKVALFERVKELNARG